MQGMRRKLERNPLFRPDRREERDFTTLAPKERGIRAYKAKGSWNRKWSTVSSRDRESQSLRVTLEAYRVPVDLSWGNARKQKRKEYFGTCRRVCNSWTHDNYP